MSDCIYCDCYDPDLGCTMPSVDKSYACPLFNDSNDVADWYQTRDDELKEI